MKPSTPNDLLDPDDFNSIEIKVRIHNNTSNCPFPADFEVRVLEFETKGMILSSPPNCCTRGHQLTLNIKATSPGTDKVIHLSTTAKVTSTEDSGRDSDRVAVTLVQYEQNSWDSLLEMIQGRQQEILQFFRSVRGTD